MSNTVIKVENLSKQYRLGQVSTGALSHDLNRLWYRMRGKEDPYLKIGEANDRTTTGSSDYVWALRDINFEVKHGEVLGIIGRNGAGKSTLLKILSRTTAPTTGSIKIKGRVASLLEVGTGFHPELSGRDNIFLNGAILGMTKKEITRKFDEIVDFAGVERYIDTPVKRYSSGMYVRLAFAVAAHLEPEILIVDEVLAVGDAEFQKKCLGKMKDVSEREGRTVLFVSHNMAAISNLCDSVLIINEGQIFFNGKTNEGVQKYLVNIVDANVQRGIAKSISQIDLAELAVKGIRISQQGLNGLQFVYNKPIVIQFLFTIKERIIGFRIGFDILDNTNDLVVFRTFHDDLNVNIDYIEPGDYESIVEIPPCLLKEGTYTLSFLAGIHNVKWLSEGDIRISFSIVNTGGINQFYADHRPGVIMPQLNWNNK